MNIFFCMPWQIAKDQLPAFYPLPFQWSQRSPSSFNFKGFFVLLLFLLASLSLEDRHLFHHNYFLNYVSKSVCTKSLWLNISRLSFMATLPSRIFPQVSS